MVNLGSIGSYNFGAKLADECQYLLVTGHCLFEVDRGIIVFFGFGKATLAHLHNAAEKRMAQIVLKHGIVYIVVHDFF